MESWPLTMRRPGCHGGWDAMTIPSSTIHTVCLLSARICSFTCRPRIPTSQKASSSLPCSPARVDIAPPYPPACLWCCTRYRADRTPSPLVVSLSLYVLPSRVSSRTLVPRRPGPCKPQEADAFTQRIYFSPPRLFFLGGSSDSRLSARAHRGSHPLPSTPLLVGVLPPPGTDHLFGSGSVPARISLLSRVCFWTPGAACPGAVPAPGVVVSACCSCSAPSALCISASLYLCISARRAHAMFWARLAPGLARQSVHQPGRRGLLCCIPSPSSCLTTPTLRPRLQHAPL
jgi:hypothetical protein